MRNFMIEQSTSEIYTSAAGLALGGLCLNKHTPLVKSSRSLAKRHGIANIDLIRTYLGLILTGKSDFEAVDLVPPRSLFQGGHGHQAEPVRLSPASTVR